MSAHVDPDEWHCSECGARWEFRPNPGHHLGFRRHLVGVGSARFNGPLPPLVQIPLSDDDEDRPASSGAGH